MRVPQNQTCPKIKQPQCLGTMPRAARGDAVRRNSRLGAGNLDAKMAWIARLAV